MNKCPGQGFFRVRARLSMRPKEIDKFRHTSGGWWRTCVKVLERYQKGPVSEYPSGEELIEALNDNVCGRGITMQVSDLTHYAYEYWEPSPDAFSQEKIPISSPRWSCTAVLWISYLRPETLYFIFQTGCHVLTWTTCQKSIVQTF